MTGPTTSHPLLIADAKSLRERYCRESAMQYNVSAAIRYRKLWNYMI